MKPEQDAYGLLVLDRLEGRPRRRSSSGPTG